jgi:5-methylcytosine-specific restriction endonuclease McrA
MTYKEQLKSPKWQKKRLEIMQRDNWKCVLCGMDDRQLQVHHKEYIKGFKAWEYPDILLITLCDICHYFEHQKKTTINDWTKMLI